MEALPVLLLVLALLHFVRTVSFEVDVMTKRRNRTRRIRFGFGGYTSAKSHKDNEKE